MRKAQHMPPNEGHLGLYSTTYNMEEMTYNMQKIKMYKKDMEWF